MTNNNQQVRTYLEEAHVLRVSAWCAEIAERLNLPTGDRQALARAARLHHQSKLTVEDTAWDALRRDLGVASSKSGETERQGTVIEILQAFQGDHGASDHIRRLVRILEQCDDLDAACELDSGVSAEPLLNGLDDIILEVNGYFGKVAGAEMDRAAARMPVFDSIAYRAIALLGNENARLAEVESLVAADQTLAGHIVSAANSVLRGSTTIAKDVRQAVTRIGMAPARQLVVAVALRRQFGARHSRSLWNHSLDVAEAAASLAEKSGRVDREQAFLAGLMHDVGKLAILNLPAPPIAQQERLRLGGCPDPIVERVILGVDHSAVGGRVLRNWRFDDSIAAAVECHHAPERSSSSLSHVLYLAELLPGKGPGLDSAWREELACDTLRLRNGDWRIPAAAETPTSSLRFAAAA